MKKMMKTFALAIALLLAAGSVTGTYASAASIYFAGRYAKSDGAKISLSQYSSPEGRVVGSFEIDIPHFYNAYNGELVKIGKNKYRSQKKGLTITVYKKKLVMKVSGSRYDKALRGTYKLKKRYPRP